MDETSQAGAQLKSTGARPVFWRALLLVSVLAVGLVAVLNLLGAPLGAPCADSYSCRGFLVGGVECVEEGPRRYCTLYCEQTSDCPTGWTCAGAQPTALGIKTSLTDYVCVMSLRD